MSGRGSQRGDVIHTQLGKSLREIVLGHFTKRSSPSFLASVEGFGEAFATYLAQFLSDPSSKKKTIAFSLTNYIKDITLYLQPLHFSSSLSTDVTPPANPPLPPVNQLSPPLQNLKNSRGSKSSYFENMSEEWCGMAPQVWNQPRWAEVLHKTAQFYGVTFTPKEHSRLRAVFTKYISLLDEREFIGSSLLRRITTDFLYHLSSHQIDPCNLFIATKPSEYISRVLVPLTEKERRFEEEGGVAAGSSLLSSSPSPSPSSSSSFVGERGVLNYLNRWSSLSLVDLNVVVCELNSVVRTITSVQLCAFGEIVAVCVDKIPFPFREWFTNEKWGKLDRWPMIFCRVTTPTLFGDKFVEVALEPFEKIVVKVPFDAVMGFWRDEDEPHILENEATTENLMFFNNPLFICVTQFIGILEKEVEKAVGIPVAQILAIQAEEITVSDINLVLKTRKLLQNLLQKKEKVGQSIIETLSNESCEWLSVVPPALFAPPRLKEALNEIENFANRLPNLIERETHFYFHLTSTYISALELRIKEILNGKRKKIICHKWLLQIEKSVDSFLLKLGYDLEAIPSDYTRKKPKDMEIILKNHQILNEIMFVGGEEMDLFVSGLTDEVYKMVDSLFKELEYTLSLVWKEIPTPEIKSIPASKEDLANIERDIEYLQTVKSMDEEIQKKKESGTKGPIQMTAVVPIAGLIMARFHIYNNECQTICMMWGKDSKMKNKEPKKKEQEGDSSQKNKTDVSPYISIASMLQESKPLPLSQSNDGQIQTTEVSERFFSFLRETFTTSRICHFLQFGENADSTTEPTPEPTTNSKAQLDSQLRASNYLEKFNPQHPSSSDSPSSWLKTTKAKVSHLASPRLSRLSQRDSVRSSPNFKQIRSDEEKHNFSSAATPAPPEPQKMNSLPSPRRTVWSSSSVNRRQQNGHNSLTLGTPPSPPSPSSGGEAGRQILLRSATIIATSQPTITDQDKTSSWSVGTTQLTRSDTELKFSQWKESRGKSEEKRE